MGKALPLPPSLHPTIRITCFGFRNVNLNLIWSLLTATSSQTEGPLKSSVCRCSLCHIIQPEIHINCHLSSPVNCWDLPIGQFNVLVHVERLYLYQIAAIYPELNPSFGDGFGQKFADIFTYPLGKRVTWPINWNSHSWRMLKVKKHDDNNSTNNWTCILSLASRDASHAFDYSLQWAT